MATLHIDKNNFLRIDGVLVCKFLPDRGCLQFVDKDRRRCEKRGTRYVEVTVADLITLCQDGTSVEKTTISVDNF